MPFIGWIISIAGWLFKLWRGAPDPKVVEGEKLGAAQANEAIAVHSVAVETAIAKAAVDAPKTVPEVEDRLRKGTF